MNRKILRKILAVSLCAAVAAGAGSMGVPYFDVITGGISVNALVSGSFEYAVSSDGTYVTINKCYSSSTSIAIPASIAGKPVKRIGNEAFSSCSKVQTVSIPDTVEYIGSMAFAGCQRLTSVTLPSSLTQIGTYAFGYCTSLKEVTIPSSVRSIGYSAFCECYSMTAIKVASGNENYVSVDGVLFNRAKDRLVQCPGAKSGKYTVPSGTLYISEYAFQGCKNITEVVLQKGALNVGISAFYECESLKKVYIPESVSSISSSAFELCGDVTIYCEKDSYAQRYAQRKKMKYVVLELSNESTVSAGVITLGGTVTVNAKASGGSGEYTYAVLYKKKADKSWTVKQNYSTNAKIAVKPAKATDYDICVKVKDGKGDIVKKFFTVKVNAKLSNSSTISADTIKYGSTFTVNAKASGGTGGYTYAVLYKKKADTKWTVKQNYSTNAKTAVKPAKVTEYDVCVKVKDSDGTIAKKFFTVNVTK